MGLTFVILLLICLNACFFVNASKILMVFNHFGKSHYIQGKALGKGLARAGHEVTMVSPFEDATTEKQKGYNEIVLKGLLDTVGIDTNFVSTEKMNPFFMVSVIHFLSTNHTLNTLNHEKFQALLKSKQEYDVIIIEDLFYLALRALSCHFRAPIILYHPFAPISFTNEVSGNPAPPSYVPNMWLGYSSSMTFWERSVNLFFSVYDTFHLYFFTEKVQDGLMKKYFPDCPNLRSLNKNISLILINNHESINPAIPKVPNMINILGFHLKEKNTLPKDLQKYMDTSKNGVILFSFGSFVHPSKMNQTIKTAFIKSLGKLKQNVLWKTDEVHIPELPKNIKLSKWLPQEDLLAHPNTKLFITHAGFVSTIETIYHGVAVLAVPLAGDQDSNAGRLTELGLGLSTNLNDVTESKLDLLLYDLLNNDWYRKNAQAKSLLLKDRPMKPMDLATYWVEYVIRHKGAPHLRVAGLDLAWYQYLLIDVIVVWSAFVLLSAILVYVIIRTILNSYKIKKKDKLL